MDFEPITTKEALDEILKAKEQEISARFEGYVSPEEYKKQTDAVADLTAKNKAYELSALKSKIARETGIPHDLSQRLSGETEKDIRADAKAFAASLSARKPAPLKSEDSKNDSTNAADSALLEMLSGME